MSSIDLIHPVMNRRRMLRCITGFFAFLLTPVLEAKKSDALPGLASDHGSKFTGILDELMGKSPQMNDQALLLEVPKVAENGALVPVTLSASDSSDSLYVLAEGNPSPLLAEFHFHGTALPKLSLRVKLNQTGPVTALSHNPRGWMRVDRHVKVAVGGCG
jgi:sulfur-oxidizing protein SoxY